VLDADGDFVTHPQVAVMGLLEAEEASETLQDVGFAVRDAVEALPRAARRDDEQVRQAARVSIRRSFNASHGKKPVTEVHLVRI